MQYIQKSYLIPFLFLFFFSTAFAQKNIVIKKVCKSPTSTVVNVQYEIKDICSNLSEIYVFGKTNVAIDFAVIDTITDLALNSFSFNAQGNNDWLVFFEYIQPCNGDSLTDTVSVDSEAPSAVTIDSVSVVGDSIIIGWEKSFSPDVEFYVPYSVDETQTNFIISKLHDSLFTDSNLFYFDSNDNRDPNSKAITYNIGVWDSCENVSITSKSHSTINLSSSNFNICDKQITLNRTDYVGWTDVNYYLVYREINDKVFKPLLSFDNLALTIDLSDLQDGEFEFKVRAIDQIDSFTTSSNVLNLDLDLESGLDTLYMTNTTVIGDSIEFSWVYDKSNFVDYFNFFWDNDSLSIRNKIEIKPNTEGKSSVRIFNNGGVYYGKVEALSICGFNIGETLSQRNIRVKLEVNENYTSCKVEWNSFLNFKAGVNRYELYKNIGFEWELLAVINLNLDTLLFSYIDDLTLLTEIDSSICYRIMAFSNDTLAFESNSNTACFVFDYHDVKPNAFIVDGINSVWYLPAVNINEDESEVFIYNRWGQRVATLNSPITIGWNGSLNNDNAINCPDGMYHYVGYLEQLDGKVFFVKGYIYLIRKE